MKKPYLLLVISLIAAALVLTGIGAYIKYAILRPYGLYQDENLIALPFMLISDKGMQCVIRDAMHPTEPSAVPTQPPESTGEPTQPPTEKPTEEPTEEPSEEPTQPPATDPPPEPTEKPTELPTEPPTDPPAEPPTDPRPGFDPEDPEMEGVPESWFDDVLFIGDSRTEEMRDYARLGKADYFCAVGLTVFDVDQKALSLPGMGTVTLDQVLSENQYGKIFISLGINECGYPMDSLMGAYTRLVEKIRDRQPDATVVLQGIMTVSRKKAASATYFQPAHLQLINERIKALADGKQIYYIDVNDSFADSEGYLPDYMSGDGCHLYAKYNVLWADWLRYIVKTLNI
ncbi:MAG: SGNH/GDSL hydrolase family protein [Firmicutes bacterium]|nr:SGNH/GDSL hydrolase family protein [Bacillota bacterium]